MFGSPPNARCQSLWLSARERGAPGFRRSHLREALGFRAKNQKVRDRDRPSPVVQERHDPFGLAIGQRSQQDAIDDTEDRSVRADPQAERENGYQSEGGILQ